MSAVSHLVATSGPGRVSAPAPTLLSMRSSLHAFMRMQWARLSLLRRTALIFVYTVGALFLGRALLDTLAPLPPIPTKTQPEHAAGRGDDARAHHAVFDGAAGGGRGTPPSSPLPFLPPSSFLFCPSFYWHGGAPREEVEVRPRPPFSPLPPFLPPSPFPPSLPTSFSATRGGRGPHPPPLARPASPPFLGGGRGARAGKKKERERKER